MKTADDLYMAIGSKNVILGDTDRNELKEKASNWKKYLTFSFGTNKENKDRPEEKASQEKINPKQILKLTDDSIQKNYAIADCCQPIPGDDVLGYMDENEKITIHKRQCPVAVKLKVALVIVSSLPRGIPTKHYPFLFISTLKELTV